MFKVWATVTHVDTFGRAALLTESNEVIVLNAERIAPSTLAVSQRVELERESWQQRMSDWSIVLPSKI